MPYFKHSEVADKYHVSLKTVYNWVETAKKGKLDLQLIKENGKSFIADTPANILMLNEHAANGKKKRSSRYGKIATPSPEFYQLYSQKQILDIFSNLKINREIPRQYNYFDQGAVYWDEHCQRHLHDANSNLFPSTIKLLHDNLSNIDSLIEGCKKVNVIDIGPGNGLPAKGLLEHLIAEQLLGRYIAIDISEQMLHIAQSNLNEWFGDAVKFEGYIRDITYERFDDLLVEDMAADEADETVNLALLLGGTPMNFPSPRHILETIRDSLGYSDLLIYTDKPESETELQSARFASQSSKSKSLSPNYRFIFDLLNIDEDLYEVEMGYNEAKHVGFIRVRLNVSLSIKFRFGQAERTVFIEKGETILLWRAWYMGTLQLISEFEKAGLVLLQATLTKDREYLLTISGVEAKRDYDV